VDASAVAGPVKLLLQARLTSLPFLPPSRPSSTVVVMRTLLVLVLLLPLLLLPIVDAWRPMTSCIRQASRSRLTTCMHAEGQEVRREGGREGGEGGRLVF